MQLALDGRIEPDAALKYLDAMRWVDRLAYHTWRTIHHLAIKRSGEPLAIDNSLQPEPASAED